MKYCHLIALGGLAAGLLDTSACQPHQPATEQPAAPAPPSASATPADTLHLPGGQVAQLHPTTAAAFNQLPVSGLPDLPNDPSSEHLPAEQGRVRRQGLALLRPARGPEVRLASTPEARFTLQNREAVKYKYWGSLPAAHQWAVRAWA